MRHAFTTSNVQVPDESVHDRPGRRAVLAARRPCGASCRCRCRRPQRPHGSACKIEFELRYAFANAVARGADQPGVRPHRQHLRRFVRAPRRAGPWAALSARRTALRVDVACSPRAGRAPTRSSCELPAGRRVLDAIARQRPARARYPRHRPGDARRSASGAGAAALDAAAARRRPGRDLPAAAGGSEGGAAPALPQPARKRARADARYLQSAAITSLRARCVSVGALLVVEDTRARRFALARAMRMPLSSVRSCALARLQFSARAAATCSCSALCLGRGVAARPSCAWPRARDRRRCGAERPMRRDARRRRPARRPARRAARAAARSACSRMSWSGVPARRRQVAVLDVAALVAPLPLRRRPAGASTRSRRRAASRTTKRSRAMAVSAHVKSRRAV